MNIDINLLYGAVGLLGVSCALMLYKLRVGIQDRSSLRDNLYQTSADNAVLHERLAGMNEIEKKRDELQDTVHHLQTQNELLRQKLETEQKNLLEKQVFIEKMQSDLSHTFKSLSFDVLEQNNKNFLELAKNNLSKWQTEAQKDFSNRQEAIAHLLKPLESSLKQVDEKIAFMEKERVGAYEGLKEQIKYLQTAHTDLRTETSNLVRALKNPSSRGRWGEIQLRRVVEMAGMLEHCDFVEQSSMDSDEKVLRPDMVIQLPGKKKILLDAKTPLDAYLKAMEADDEAAKTLHLRNHAKHVRQHVKTLSSKNYLQSLKMEEAPEFMILFLPGDTYFSAALEMDPSLIEFGIESRVIIATPTTLIAILRAIAFGWQQERMAENVQHIASLGRELYKRLAVMGGHVTKLGKQIGTVVDTYNQTVGTLERRVMSTARKFKDLEPSSHDQQEIEQIEKTTRQLSSPELLSEEKE